MGDSWTMPLAATVAEAETAANRKGWGTRKFNFETQPPPMALATRLSVPQNLYIE